MLIERATILACDDCYNLRSSAPAGALREQLLGVALVACGVVVAMAIVAIRRHGRARLAAVLVAVGIAIATAAVPGVVSETTTTFGGRRTYCDRPISASTNEFLVGNDPKVAACRAAIDDSLEKSRALLAVGGSLVVLGLLTWAGPWRRRDRTDTEPAAVVA